MRFNVPGVSVECDNAQCSESFQAGTARFIVGASLAGFSLDAFGMHEDNKSSVTLASITECSLPDGWRIVAPLEGWPNYYCEAHAETATKQYQKLRDAAAKSRPSCKHTLYKRWLDPLEEGPYPWLCVKCLTVGSSEDRAQRGMDTLTRVFLGAAGLDESGQEEVTQQQQANLPDMYVVRAFYILGEDEEDNPLRPWFEPAVQRATEANRRPTAWERMEGE